MVGRRAGELEDADGVKCRERPELFEHATIKSSAMYGISQVRSVNNPAAVQSAQWDNVYRSLLWQVSPLRPDISDRKQVLSWQSLLNRQAHVCNSREIVRVNIPRTDVDVGDG